MNRRLYELIAHYACKNEQERCDRSIMLDFIKACDDVTTRNNQIAHFTASPWIINSTKTKALMIYHNIYDSWGWCGGHLDGDDDALAVAVKEGKEETGLSQLQIISDQPIAIDILPVHGHWKNGRYISSHLHFNLTYLCMADEAAVLKNKPDENSAAAWFAFTDIFQAVSEEAMKPIYDKLIRQCHNI